MADEWRRVIAALANPDLRLTWARLVLGAGEADATAGLSPARRRKVLDGLRGAGLVDESFAPRATVFAEALAAAPVPVQPKGPERFLRDGRITQYPASQSERAELLALVASRAFGSSEVLDEREVNERLARFHDDVAVLRRYLVDFGLLVRTRSGSSYALADESVE
ncbi:DUF2087 domain-containing protein [Gryllotalpicola protaetiae]|uniref:DUF2087 domain-containing protein n=1 Tax=Gryllotalpicola protaetiae TaxID=2419771 RepID=A0A387BL73_9MICO|nr:DUF2087 domain-containing protein [Gryllotalpicola protaetiae]AYG04925.1 DUF2087 domain-containing protein [Gryllotalpicola protaetiae]